MIGTMNGFDPVDVKPQLEAFKRADQERERLVHSLVEQLEKIHTAYQEKCDDYENEVESRRTWQDKYKASQKEVQKIQIQLASTKQDVDSDPFALALIDGDGVLFQDALVSAVAEGGADAAHKLQKEIKNHLSSQNEGAGKWPILVQVYANLDGLSRKLAAVGVIKHAGEFQMFSKAFSFNQPLFSFVDVGSGKERADHKIKEMFRFFVNNHQCKHILFAGCHDTGYLNILDQYKRDESMASRITLLESTPAERGFTALNFKTISFPSIFRTAPLPDRAAPPVLPVKTPPPPASTPPPLSSSNSWAAVGGAGVTNKSFSIAPAQQKGPTKKFILRNQYGERIDTQLGKPDKPSMDNLYSRIGRNKLCNTWHIRGQCEGFCGYEHGEKLPPGELLALKVMARSRPCQSLDQCVDFECIYGHHCPYGTNCLRPKCFFEGAHNVDQVVKVKIYEDWSSEHY